MRLSAKHSPPTLDAIVDQMGMSAIRISISTDGERWTITTLKGTFKNTYNVPDHLAVQSLLDELIGPATCYVCGAPLLAIGRRTVCLRHWNHYPQPVKTEIVGFIEPKRTYNGFRHPIAAETRERRASWRHFNKIANELLQVAETQAPDGRRMINARWRATDTVDANRLLTGTGLRWNCARHQEVRFAYVPPGYDRGPPITPEPQ